jgi:hypothetical protein
MGAYLFLIPFGIRGQSCFLILAASESIINHAFLFGKFFPGTPASNRRELCLKILVLFFFVKYTTMLYQWQLVKNKVIQSNFPANFHDKISLRISLLQEELKSDYYSHVE